MTTTPKRAARETDFYSLESPDLDPYQVPPLLFETLLSKVEAWGKEFIDAAVADPGFVIDDELRARFSRYMGFQYVRGRSSRWFAISGLHRWAGRPGLPRQIRESEFRFQATSGQQKK